MNRRSIAIIGGGPAGATAAETLARGWELWGTAPNKPRVMIFEERIGWEKPCGGGLSHKALRRYPFLAAAANGGNLLRKAEFLAPSGAALRFHLRAPMAIYSRAELNQLLLRRAEQAGAGIVADRILRLRRIDSGWEMAGRKETYRADFVVLAAGARTRLRQHLTANFPAQDLMLTLGYFLPGTSDLLRIQFYNDFEGYAWAFPRPDHLSVGVCGKAGVEPMSVLRERLADFMHKFGYAPDPERIFGHVLPSLSVDSWSGIRLTGNGWALAGDAAGLVDPITGEGIYYAMRSGQLLAEALLEGYPELYPERVRTDFGKSLALAARLAHLFYHGDFVGGGITTRMIEFGRRSRRFLEVVQDLVEGTQSYMGLIIRLQMGLTRALLETGAGRLREAIALPQLTEG